MKNRKIILVAFILVACMVIGVGYAAIEKAITISGTASLHPQNFNVVFTSAELVTLTNAKEDGVVPTVSVENTQLSTTAPSKDLGGIFATSMTVSGLACIEDVVVVDYEIENRNNVSMYLNPAITGATVFSVTGQFIDTDNGNAASDTFTLASEETIIYRVTVKLSSDAFDTEKTESFNISINATSTIPTP